MNKVIIYNQENGVMAICVPALNCGLSIEAIAEKDVTTENFKIIDNGAHVICAVSGKKISLDNLNYWNVETQEAYYSYKEAHQKRESET